MTQHRDGRGTLSSTLLLIAANILLPIAILIFATGFFPYKPLLPGLAQYATLPEYGEPPEPPFDKLVFMVIDALRRYFIPALPIGTITRSSQTNTSHLHSDFVYSTGSGFSFTHG